MRLLQNDTITVILARTFRQDFRINTFLLCMLLLIFRSGYDMGRVSGEMTRDGKQMREKHNFPVKSAHLLLSDVLIYFGVALANIQICFD